MNKKKFRLVKDQRYYRLQPEKIDIFGRKYFSVWYDEDSYFENLVDVRDFLDFVNGELI
jgi:hypothetical protein